VAIHNVRFRDAGSKIVSKVEICNQDSGRFHMNVITNHEDGGDRRVERFYADVPRGCGDVVNIFPDRLKWKGWYIGHMKVRQGGTDWVQTSGRRFFYSR